MYKDLLMAFNGVKEVEQFDRFKLKEEFKSYKKENSTDSNYKLKLKQMLYGMDGTEEF